jgi:hypothetical protein
MKSHDHHVMVQQVLPVNVQNLLQASSRTTIIQLEKSIQRIFTKVLNPKNLVALQTCVVETICCLRYGFHRIL